MRALHAYRPILGLAVCLLVPAAAVTPARQPKLNVLVLFADDMRADAVAAYGNPHIRTPNIDALAAAGFSFRGNYVFGGNSAAVCVPSRAMLMSATPALTRVEHRAGEGSQGDQGDL